eukprot:TRINITY_DN59341_c0_g1_i1.p1 TRINITY_DN59341_c0_g1~~TRINITY_DN59341_c0_g1_i1.p1  ORF type:complete len:206 (+),score=27.04 TRINITY_DN59341_c0_g1_i1:177-794(+)
MNIKAIRRIQTSKPMQLLLLAATIAVGGVVGTYLKTESPLFTAIAGLVGLFGLRTLHKRVTSTIVKTMLANSLKAQKVALTTFKPDVVVGSSWGGGVVLHLLDQGLWNGPTVLVAPAHRLMARRMGEQRQLRLIGRNGVVVVHGTHDATVPIQHSKDLISSADGDVATTFIEVDDQHPVNVSGTPQAWADWIETAVGNHEEATAK